MKHPMIENIKVGDKFIVKNTACFHSTVQEGAIATVTSVMSYGVDLNIEGCTANPQFSGADWFRAHLEPIAPKPTRKFMKKFLIAAFVLIVIGVWYYKKECMCEDVWFPVNCYCGVHHADAS